MAGVRRAEGRERQPAPDAGASSEPGPSQAAQAGRSAPLVPYVPASQTMAELTSRAVILGALLSVTFGMVNAYLALKVGLTVSASIPSAVISMAVLRGILRRGTILENNLVHTIGSAGDSLAAGVVFTVPALLFLGLAPGGFLIFLLGATAGLLGILTMIPMRRELTLREHGSLPFPEGTACAEVLIAGDRGGANARPVVEGVAGGVLYQVGVQLLGLWRERFSYTSSALHKATLGFDLTPIFLGAGYLIGPRIAGVMASGGVLAWAVLVPLADVIAGSRLGLALEIPAAATELDATALWRAHVRFIGAGAVTMGGLLSLAGIAPVLLGTLRRRRRPRSAAGREERSALPTSAGAGELARTDRDLPRSVVVAGIAMCGLALWLVPTFGLGAIESLLAVSFSAFFVVVSARIVGLVGTTSQPVSGMTITALLATCAVLALLGHSGPSAMAASITVGAVVAISISLAGDLSQDLKTAALVGATPHRVQIGEMIGVLAAAVRAGWVLLLLHQAYEIGSEALPAPQARLMATLVEGVAQGHLPWGLMLIGAALAAAVASLGVSSLAFAIGLYLPITTTAPLLLGGLVRAALDRRAARRAGRALTVAELDVVRRRPTLVASGMIAGEAIAGIATAGLVVVGAGQALRLRVPGAGGAVEALLTLGAWLALVTLLARGAGPASPAAARELR